MQLAMTSLATLSGYFRCRMPAGDRSRIKQMTRSFLPLLRLMSSHLHKVSLIILASICLVLPQHLRAQEDGIVPVKVIAPDDVRKIIEKYIVLPEGFLKTESEEAIFIRNTQREIAELLSTEGYFSAKTEKRSVSKDGTLELEVIPGRRTVVTEVNIEFRGDLALKESQRIERVNQMRASWTLKPGSPFRSASWDNAKADLLAQVGNQDYAAARLVESSAQIDKAKAIARLNVVVDSGTRFLFGEIRVTGLERYDELLISRYTTFKPGQPYHRDLLLEFQTKLQSLPQFNSVIVILDTALNNTTAEGEQPAMPAPVKVRVSEAKSSKIAIGIGYSSNNGVRNEINYQSYNFFDQAWILDTALVLEQNRQKITASVDTPPNSLGYHLTWNGSGERTQIQGLETRGSKLGLTRSRTLYGIETGIGLYWQQEQKFPEGGVRETAQALVPDWNWIRKKVDDPLFPMSGTLTQVRVGVAYTAMLSDQDFVRSYVRFQNWLQLGERDLLLLRIEGGYTAADSRSGIPQDYLFRVGGTQTVRGFAYQSLGVQEGDAVVGGRVMATGSAEYTHWFSNWGVAFFYDAGGATDIPSDLSLSLGYGIGARWRSPIGPLALDLAQGKGEPDSRFHFAIAVAF